MRAGAARKAVRREREVAVSREREFPDRELIDREPIDTEPFDRASVYRSRPFAVTVPDSRRGENSDATFNNTPTVSSRPGSISSFDFTPPYTSPQPEAYEAVAVDGEDLQACISSLQMEVSELSGRMRCIIQEELERGIKATLRKELKKFFEKLVIEPVHSGEHSNTAASPSESKDSARKPKDSAPSSSTSAPKSKDTFRNAEDGSSAVAKHDATSALSEPLLGHSEGQEGAQSAGSQQSVNKVQQLNRSEKDQIARRKSVLKDESEEREMIKERLNEALQEDVYNKEDLYSKTGIFQALARTDSWFSELSLAMVAANVIWIGVDEDLNRADVLSRAPLLSQIMNNVFCVFFTFELFVNILAFQNKCNALKDGQVLFDCAIVGFMIWETWIEVALYRVFDVRDASTHGMTSQIFRFFRLFRLTRIPRIVRLSSSLPELMILMKGLATAMRSVSVILLFIMITIFLFSIVFTELLRDEPLFSDDFGTVPRTMNTLLLQVLCGPDIGQINDMLKISWVYYLLYLVFLFVTLLTLMNMLIGVLCDVVSSATEEEQETMALKKIEHDIERVARTIDEDNDGSISKDEFWQLMKHKDALRSLDSIGVDVVAFGGLSSYIFGDDDEITLSEFCQLVARFRGGRSASVQDLMDAQRYITNQIELIAADLKQMIRQSRLQHKPG